MKKYEDYIDTKEASQITGYHVGTIRRFAKTGRLKMFRPGPESRMKFKRSDIEKFMRSGSSAGK